MAAGKVTLYVDILSPFAYIGYWLTRNSPAFKDVDVDYVPILLGGLMNLCGTQPPISIKNKDKWIELERERWAKLFKISIAEKAPAPFPQSTITTQRALCYIQSTFPPSKFAEALDALYNAFWIERKTIGKVDVIAQALQSVFEEHELKDIMEAIKSDAVKKSLLDNTDKAFKAGAFGLPWFTATTVDGRSEGFWGVDHIGQMLHFLGIEREGSEGYKALL